jgi:hypothetical protein
MSKDGPPATRCRYAFGGGCPGLLAQGRKPTKAESDTLVATQRQARGENRPAGKGGGKGKGKGRVLQLAASSGGSRGGGGGGGGGLDAVRTGIQAVVDCITANGGAHAISTGDLQQTIAELAICARGQPGP